MSAAAISIAPLSGMEPLLAGLDGLAHGVAVMDAVGYVKYANAAARIVMDTMGWDDDVSYSVSVSTAHARLWSDALHRVCGRGRRELLQLPLGDSLGYASMTPVNVLGQCFAFITFGRSELCGPVELEMFAQRCGLTSSEGMVLRQLCRGMTSVQIAQAHGVATCTVLTQIAAIRNKTLFKSVRELLDSLSRMPPLMAVGMRPTRASGAQNLTLHFDAPAARDVRSFQRHNSGLAVQAH
jgi:DNA-binding CsgD family transcriptional regulator